MTNKAMDRPATGTGSPVLPIEDIRRLYDGEWVLLDDLELNETPDVLAGRVLAHSPSRDEIRAKMRELHPQHFAIFYVGQITGEFFLNL